MYDLVFTFQWEELYETLMLILAELLKIINTILKIREKHSRN